MFGFKKRRERIERETKMESGLRSLEMLCADLKRSLQDANDEIALLNKLSNKKEIKIVETVTWIFPNSDESVEESRAKCRAEGYSFCHKMRNGNEVWAKY